MPSNNSSQVLLFFCFYDSQVDISASYVLLHRRRAGSGTCNNVSRLPVDTTTSIHKHMPRINSLVQHRDHYTFTDHLIGVSHCWLVSQTKFELWLGHSFEHLHPQTSNKMPPTNSWFDILFVCTKYLCRHGSFQQLLNRWMCVVRPASWSTTKPHSMVVYVV